MCRYHVAGYRIDKMAENVDPADQSKFTIRIV